MKFAAEASNEMKSTHRRSDFIRAKRGFHIAKQYFTHLQGWISLKKT